MGLFKRMRAIISANLNELAEDYEDPELMLKQAVREMEASIAEATRETAKALASQKLIAKELAHNEDEARQWQARAEKAVAAGDDAAARKALARKREHDKLVVALRDQLKTADDTGQALRRQLDGMKAKLAEAKRNLATLAARHKAAEFRKKMAVDLADVGPVDEPSAFAQFDRLRERVEAAEAEAEALAELRRGGEAPDDVTDAGDRDKLDIEAELEALKKKSGVKS
jgi:phage shock protein A